MVTHPGPADADETALDGRTCIGPGHVTVRTAAVSPFPIACLVTSLCGSARLLDQLRRLRSRNAWASACGSPEA